MVKRASELATTQAFILAGGQGERLNPLTVMRAKPAVSFGGMFRIIDFTLSNCLHSGLDRVSVLTQYRHEDLHEYVGEGWSKLWNNGERPNRSPLALLPPARGKRYRGTADAIFQNREHLQSDGSEFVLVLSGDHVYHMDYREFVQQHAETGADLTIAAVEYPLADASPFGVVEVDADFKVTGFEEKPASPRPIPSRPSMALVSMGVYVFTKKALLQSLRSFCETGRGYDFGHDIIPSLIQSGRTYAYDFRNAVQDSPRYWRDIGTLDGYYAANMELADPDGPFDPFANDGWPSQPTRHPSDGGRRLPNPSQYLDGSVRVTRSIVPPDADLAEGVTIDESVLLPGVQVGRGARLRRAIVEEGVSIPAGFEVGFDRIRDCQRYKVTDSGVVVVSRTPVEMKPTVVFLNSQLGVTKNAGKIDRVVTATA